MAVDRPKRRRSRLAVLFLDLDRFKPVNDTYGHDQGDALLKGIADRLSNACRAGEFVGRLAGDKFTILAEDINPGDEALICRMHPTRAGQALRSRWQSCADFAEHRDCHLARMRGYGP
jgi:diguanylate cyclase (GGDEF)-like protein